MSARIKPLPVLVALLVAVCALGCGATPPQAPHAQARTLNDALGGISTACGLSSQVTAFPGNHQPDLTTLEDTASSSARKLASIYKQNPAWIYYNDTVRELVTDSVSMLRSCGLGGAAHTLVKTTSQG